MREALLASLDAHRAFDAAEEGMRVQLREFVAGYENCFSRALLIGHVTASCWVVDPSRTHALLTWHKRLDRWLQMGGHVEPEDVTLLGAAERELREESGLVRWRTAGDSIFDVDVHAIPAKGAEPEHFHYDVRFLFEANPEDSLIVSSESRALAWVALDDIAGRNADASMLRMVAKTTSTTSLL